MVILDMVNRIPHVDRREYVGQAPEFDQAQSMGIVC